MQSAFKQPLLSVICVLQEPDEGGLEDVSGRKSSLNRDGLILVASLIDKPTNLGGTGLLHLESVTGLLFPIIHVSLNYKYGLAHRS